MFTLTERVTINASGTDTFATIDLGSYVDVGGHKRYKILKGKLQAETRRLYGLVPLVGQDRQFKKL